MTYCQRNVLQAIPLRERVAGEPRSTVERVAYGVATICQRKSCCSVSIDNLYFTRAA